MKTFALKVAAPAAFVLLFAAHAGHSQIAVDKSAHNKDHQRTAEVVAAHPVVVDKY